MIALVCRMRSAPATLPPYGHNALDSPLSGCNDVFNHARCKKRTRHTRTMVPRSPQHAGSGGDTTADCSHAFQYIHQERQLHPHSELCWRPVPGVSGYSVFRLHCQREKDCCGSVQSFELCIVWQVRLPGHYDEEHRSCIPFLPVSERLSKRQGCSSSLREPHPALVHRDVL